MKRWIMLAAMAWLATVPAAVMAEDASLPEEEPAVEAPLTDTDSFDMDTQDEGDTEGKMVDDEAENGDDY